MLGTHESWRTRLESTGHRRFREMARQSWIDQLVTAIRKAPHIAGTEIPVDHLALVKRGQPSCHIAQHGARIWPVPRSNQCFAKILAFEELFQPRDALWRVTNFNDRRQSANDLWRGDREQ